MLAFQLVSAHTTELREVAVSEPGPGEVLVKVGAAGACLERGQLAGRAAVIPDG
jgi:Zn-dependent alcohol dehydrogenase